MTLIELHREIRAEIRTAIAEGKTTQQRIARTALFSQGSVSNVLHGKRKASLYYLSEIAEAAGIDIEASLLHRTPGERTAETGQPQKRDGPRQHPPPRTSHNLDHPWNRMPRKLKPCLRKSPPEPRP